MRDLLSNPGFVALVGTLFGSAGLKVVEHWLGRARTKAAESASYREELRKEIESLRAQLEKADGEELRLQGVLDEWKTKWYDLRDEKQQALTELTILKERLAALEAKLAKRDSAGSN